eukprot:scaffold13798_cov36-Tisochrysis_lutea.AAC.1
MCETNWDNREFILELLAEVASFNKYSIRARASFNTSVTRTTDVALYTGAPARRLEYTNWCRGRAPSQRQRRCLCLRNVPSHLSPCFLHKLSTARLTAGPPCGEAYPSFVCGVYARCVSPVAVRELRSVPSSLSASRPSPARLPPSLARPGR